MKVAFSPYYIQLKLYTKPMLNIKHVPNGNLTGKIHMQEPMEFNCDSSYRQMHFNY